MKYNKVPNIITIKDLIYLEDMYKWNDLALKFTRDNKKKILDKTIKSLFEKAENVFKKNLEEIINILERAINESK